MKFFRMQNWCSKSKNINDFIDFVNQDKISSITILLLYESHWNLICDNWNLLLSNSLWLNLCNKVYYSFNNYFFTICQNMDVFGFVPFTRRFYVDGWLVCLVINKFWLRNCNCNVRESCFCGVLPFNYLLSDHFKLLFYLNNCFDLRSKRLKTFLKSLILLNPNISGVL